MDGPRLHEMLTPGSGPPRPMTGTTRAGRTEKASGTRPAIVSSLDPQGFPGLWCPAFAAGLDDDIIRRKSGSVPMNTPVLVLNTNFEPLNVCSTRRALCLLVAGKAEMLLNGRGYVRTVRLTIPRPSVIRLGYMVRRPRPRVRLTKREVFRRDGHRCQYCGRQSSRLTIDHVTPRHRGGDHTWTNLVTACAECNLRKGGRMLREAHMSLLRSPGEPRATPSYLFARHLPQNEAWQEFLAGW
jgi:5-methylcytosine-specific restriction endonuclease McrA